MARFAAIPHRTPGADHHPRVEGAGNFRDLAGIRVDGGTICPGHLLRSDELSGIGDLGRNAIAGLGVRTVIDLRESAEREAHPDAIAGLGLRTAACPLLDDRIPFSEIQELAPFYVAMVDRCGRQITGAIAAFCAAEALPAIVHCSAGKDRTGVVCAVLLRALGASVPAVVADYAATSLRGATRERAKQRAHDNGTQSAWVAAHLEAPPAVMRAMLEHLDAAHGGARAYLRAHGVDEALAGLRTAVVLPD